MSDVIEINNLDLFISLLEEWHSEAVKELEHFKEIPDDTEVEVNDNAGIILSGDIRAGFLAGIELALIKLGTLPYTTIEEDVDEEEKPD